MQKAIFALLATACLATTAYAKSPEVKYDRFKQQTDLTNDSRAITHNTGNKDTSYVESVAITATVKDTALVTLQLGFVFAHNHWAYLQCHDLNFLVDGKPWTPAGTNYQNSMSRQAEIEIITANISREQLAQLASAQKIEYRICQDEQIIDARMLEDVKDFGPALDKALSDDPAAAPGKP